MDYGFRGRPSVLCGQQALAGLRLDIEQVTLSDFSLKPQVAQI